jgi:putative peptide zinc metalloprotease protein
VTTESVVARPAGPAAEPVAPRLADGIELIGPYQGSGYREPKYLVGRADGQVVQLSHLLYRLAAALDGRSTPAELAARVGAELDRPLGAEQVVSLVESKLRPAGIVDGAAAEPVPASDPRPDHLLMLRHRLPVVPERVSWSVAGIFRPLHRPAAVVALLATFVALDVAILATGGAGQVVPAALAIVDRPASTLLVLGLIVLSGMFHECGHVSACRYGGARPGPMGVGIYLVWPAFYSTVTDTYRLSRAGRLRTDLGGVYFNAVFIAAMSAVHLATGAPWLLVAILALHVETVRQFLPSIRLDGYYILSDLIGLPDLFTFLVPVLKSAVPGHPPDPRVAELKPAVRRTIVAWVLFVVPFLAFFLISFVALAPQVVPVVGATLRAHLADAAAAVREAAPAAAVLSVVQALLLLLPVLGAVLILAMVLRRLARPLLPPRRRAPAARPGRVLLVVAVPVVLVALLALAGVDQRAATAGEALIAARAARATAAPWPEAVAAQQIAALQALFADVGQHSVIDAARAVLVLLGVLAGLLLWTVCRRLGLPAPLAGVAVALSGTAAPLVVLHAAVDPGGVAAVWLAAAACLAGRGPGASTAAYGAALVAALTAPVAAVGLLAFIAHGAITGQVARRLPQRGRQVLAAGSAMVAAVVALRGTGAGAGQPSVALLAVLLVAGAAVAGLTWWRLPRLRPVATGVTALLTVAAVSAPRSTTALLLAVPALAVLAAALLDRAIPRGSPRQGRVVLAAVLVAGLATSGTLVPAAAAADPDRDALAVWVRSRLDPAVALQADPLTIAQLRRAGVAPDRLLPAGPPPPPGAAVVDVARPGAGSSPAAGRVLVEIPQGPGGSPATVRLPGDAAGSTR